MAYLLDTNIVIHARDGEPAVLARLEQHDGSVILSALSLAELERGVYKNPANAALRRQRLDIVLRHIPVVPFTEQASRAYGAIIGACGYARGRDYDRMIAAHAIVSGSVLVTDNTADFRDIPGLKIENWLAG